MSSKTKESTSPEKKDDPTRFILVVDDDPGIGRTLEMVLGDQGYEVTACEDGAEGFATAAEGVFHVVVVDYRIPGMGGLELLGKLIEAEPGRPVILMTAYGNTELAIESTKRGAFDYLQKPFDVDELVDSVTRAAEASKVGMRSSRDKGKAPAKRSGRAARPSLIGDSRAMQQVYKSIGKVAPTEASVLVLGETGTGKELVARSLHRHSTRSGGPFVAVNCGAIPENLLESELFGHVKGAFTGADSNREGRFEQADGGTLFLDEIGDMPVAIQVKLLRVLQEGTFHRLGNSEERSADVRVVAATHRDIPAMIREGGFREDLYFRLNAMQVKIPALRERVEDIPVLVRHFAATASRDYGVSHALIPKNIMTYLQRQEWPGNVRQLENTVRHLVLHARGFAITREMVDLALANSGMPADEAGTSDPTEWDAAISLLLDQVESGETVGIHGVLVSRVEKALIEKTLRRTGGHLGRAAEWLGISRVTLRKRIAELDIDTGKGKGA